MDKKTRLNALLAVSFAILLICLAVFFVNHLGKEKKQTLPQSSQAPAEEQIDEKKDKAFLYDSAFLDEEQPFMDEEEWEKAFDKNLFVSASSVERDLRVTILDSSGHVVTGESFFVKVNGVGEYKDLDADGRIYISGLRPGTYEVSVKEHGDYVLPPAMKVSVKDKIEYARIEDISYLIKTEDEIDAASEDTRKRQVESDATEVTDTWSSEGMGALGIDVSKWNKEIDWTAVKEDGVKFVIIRCGYRGSKTGALVQDPYFIRNIEGASAAGLQVGVYFFTQAITEVEAVEEASMVLSLTEGYELSMPIFIDTEGSGGRADSLNVTERTAICKAFCDTIEASGGTAGIYASRNWYQTKLNDTTFDSYVKWLAEYRKEPLYTGAYDIWQYTSSGSVNGIEGRVDLNLSYE